MTDNLYKLIGNAMDSAYENGFTFSTWTYRDIAEDLVTLDSDLEKYSPDDIEPVLREWYQKEHITESPMNN